MADPNLEVRGGNGFLPLALPAFLLRFPFFFFLNKRGGEGRRRRHGAVGNYSEVEL